MTNTSNMNSNYINNMEPYSHLTPNNGGSTSDNSMETQSHLPRVRRNIISAASSIASGNSAKTSSSISTLPSAASATMGSAAASGSIAIKNLLQMNNQQQQQQHQDSTRTKTNTNDNNSTPSQPSDQTTVVTNSSSSSIHAALSAASSNRSTSTSTTTTSPSSIMLRDGPPHAIAEFLFQLTKMLTDNNTRYIEWRDGSIVVHDPPGVEKDILPKYFRHSNYSSFQRQMNYFGFRKMAGKGKMAPCSYENEKATKDISSLLYIKRKKAGMSAAAAKLIAQQKNLRMLEKAKQTGSSGLNANLGLMGGAAGLHIQQVQQLQANQQLQAHQQLQAAQLQAAHLQAAQLQAQLHEEQLQVKLPFASASLPLNHHQAVAAQDINNLVSSRNSSSLDMQAASLLNTQQTMLAQLQQAHANALKSNPPIPNHGGISQGQLQQPAQSIQPVNNNGNWSNNDAQSLLHQASLSAQNSLGGISRSCSLDNLVRIDSAASLRALLNQQICNFNTTGEIGQGSMVFQQEGGDGSMATSAQGNANTQGLPTFDLNDVFQTQQTGEMGGGGSVVNTDTALQHFQQHLLQQGGNNYGAYSDLFGPGGGSSGGGAQG